MELTVPKAIPLKYNGMEKIVINTMLLAMSKHVYFCECTNNELSCVQSKIYDLQRIEWNVAHRKNRYFTDYVKW